MKLSYLQEPQFPPLCVNTFGPSRAPDAQLANGPFDILFTRSLPYFSAPNSCQTAIQTLFTMHTQTQPQNHCTQYINAQLS